MTGPDDPTPQIAALPIRWDTKSKLRVLMVTSRDTGRWVMPKGWLMDGKKPWRAAEIEALEEAGAIGYISKEALGVYHYLKRMPDDADTLCRVTVYPMNVERLKRRWKERGARKRRWFSPKKASRLVIEDELAGLLARLADNPARQPVLDRLRKVS